MSDLLQLLIVVTAYGGFVCGLLVLASGLYFAQRTSSVIACAVGAFLLFTGQIGFFVFVSAFAGFSGDSGQYATIIRWLSLTCAALVVGFLAFKLPRTWGKTIATPSWLHDGAKIAAAIIVAYTLYLVGNLALRLVYPPGGGSPPTSPATWFTMLAGPVLAWGLWRHYRWAWYAALAGAAYALFRTLWFMPPRLSDLPFLLMVTPVGISLLMLVSLLGVLLFSNARKLCALEQVKAT